MLAFSLPLVPASVAAWGMNLSDRNVVRAFEGFAAAGVYSAGYTAGLVITAVAVAPFTLAWGAAYWEIARTPEARRVFSRVLTAFVVVATFAAVGLGSIGTDAIRILLGDQFELARFVVPFSAFSSVLYGVYTILTTGLNLESQTRWLPLTMGAAALGNLALNLILVPPLGFMGAALASIVSYAQLAVTSGWVSQRYYRVEWDSRRVLGSLTMGAALTAAALLGPDLVLWRLGCIVAYPLAIVYLRIVRMDELRMVRDLISRRRGR
jgi:O-antigen/teichoic acid export membrane protein